MAILTLSLVGDMVGDAHIDEGFLDNLENGVEMKPVPSNSVRTEHGETELDIEPKKASREVMLPFAFGGTNAREQCKAFIAQLQSASMIHLLANDATYKLRYIGKSNTYKSYAYGKVIKVNIRFKEPNPNDR
ncbi:MAG: hypothetical protein IJ640_09035 [Prevotella sp.]|nr:hypothetical protein [Prevotella sp.]